jgi:hypothetical protein
MVALPPQSPPRYGQDRRMLGFQRVPSRYWLYGIVSALFCGALLVSTSHNQHKELWAKANKVGSKIKLRTFGVPIAREAWSDADFFIDNGIVRGLGSVMNRQVNADAQPLLFCAVACSVNHAVSSLMVAHLQSANSASISLKASTYN